MSKMSLEAKEASARVQDLFARDGEIYAALGRRLRDLNPAMVATIARGSSDHAATYASYLIPYCTGRVVSSIAPSLVSVLNAPLNLGGQFTLAISQSGRSPDIIGAFERAKKSGSVTAAIVNDVNSPVAGLAEFLLPQHAGPEGIAATKTVLCTLAAIARLTAEWTQDREFMNRLERLPAALDRAHEIGLRLNDQMLRGVASAYVLSRGLGLSSALEIALKLKETCGIHAEAFSTAEVRHGPREIVNDEFMVIALPIAGSGGDDVRAAAAELKAQGAKVMSVELDEMPEASDPRIAPMLMLAVLYPWLARCSVVLGLDPDVPRVLKSKVIRTL